MERDLTLESRFKAAMEGGRRRRRENERLGLLDGKGNEGTFMRSKSFLRVVFHRVIKSANGLANCSPVLLRAAACSCFSFILIIFS